MKRFQCSVFRSFSLLVSAFCLLSVSGCCSMYAVRAHNANVATARALRLEPAANGQGAMLKVDLLSLDTGYFASWASDPAGMALATGEDALMAAGAVYAAKLVKDHYSSSGSDTSATPTQSTPSTITSGRSTVVNYSGTVNITESQHDNGSN